MSWEWLRYGGYMSRIFWWWMEQLRGHFPPARTISFWKCATRWQHRFIIGSLQQGFIAELTAGSFHHASYEIQHSETSGTSWKGLSCSCAMIWCDMLSHTGVMQTLPQAVSESTHYRFLFWVMFWSLCSFGLISLVFHALFYHVLSLFSHQYFNGRDRQRI